MSHMSIVALREAKQAEVLMAISSTKVGAIVILTGVDCEEW